MAGIRNLTRTEAIERARLLDVTSYHVSLDVTDGAGYPGEGTFRSRSLVRFRCAEPGASTFIEIAADRLRTVTLNGAPVDTAGYSTETGLPLPGLAAENELVVEADCPYSTSGQGLHRAVDPVDKEVYLYSQFETTDAQRVFACFDQPDLKAKHTFEITVPAHWRAISNMPIAAERPAEPEVTGGTSAKTVTFAETPPMSTYIGAICAGPYHEVTDSHDGVDLGVYCRRSLARYLDADDVFTITKQGFDFFQNEFDARYPLPKYDQIFVPEYNAGAMENFGCVTMAEEYYLFRSQVTDYDYEQRANTILHELAHMWFGDLVTMRWWDDLWLNESFAEWASHWCNAEATRFSDAWATFLSLRKAWGYRQDQLSSTHPVYCEIPDVAAVEVNFDGITYAKGASIIKQLVAYVGRDSFVTGLREYFRSHAFGNATFDDLLSALENASGRELRKFAADWLETAQVNTLRPAVEVGPDGTYTSVSVLQEAPADYPTLRTHRIGVGLYDLDSSGTTPRLVRRERLEIDVSGSRTDIPELTGVRQPDVLLLNDDDLTYAKLRLDDRSRQTVVEHIAAFESAVPRALCWTAAIDMLRDAELPTREFLRLVLSGLPAESDINLVTVMLRQVEMALSEYADRGWAPQGWQQLSDGARAAMLAAAPGSDFQLAWARQYASAARDPKDLAVLRGWLDGEGVPDGLTVDTELRWTLLQCLVSNGAAGEDEIATELRSDQTASGERLASMTRAMLPDPAAKAEVWRRITEDTSLPNWLHRAMVLGFQPPTQVELLEPYRRRYFDTVSDVWNRFDGEVAQVFVTFAYPLLQVDQDTVTATEAWLAEPGRPGPLRRLVAEGRDRTMRALAARARDTAAANE